MDDAADIDNGLPLDLSVHKNCESPEKGSLRKLPPFPQKEKPVERSTTGTRLVSTHPYQQWLAQLELARMRKAYMCQYCNACFTTRGGLRLHSRIHTGERPYACDLCTARFTLKTNLTMHMRTHTGEKPYACPFSDCNARFSQNVTLKHHVRHHTGEKPFPCPVCFMRFAWKSVMKRHLKLHTGEKRYQCNACNANYTSSNGLKKHKLTHEESRPWKCSKCKATFLLRGDLTLHLRVMHDADSEEYKQLASALYKLNNPDSDSKNED